MCDNNIYYGRGTKEMFDDYIDFINYVFGFNGNSSDFKKLLPKLYKYDLNPAGSSYVVTENGKLKAAVGAFDHDIEVCGKVLKTRGIGNVAVHPYSRGKGYMKALMNMAIDDMIKEGIVLSVLGGRRQRYNYFSYDKLGKYYVLSFCDDNFRHTYGNNRKHDMEIKRLSADDTAIIGEIKKLSESYSFHAIRDSERYFDILSSWKQKVYVGFVNGAFVGYAVENSSQINELLLTDVSMIREFVSALFDHLDSKPLQIKIPSFLPEYVDRLCTLCETAYTEPSKLFAVLNYKEVVEAFLKLKSEYTSLPDGELVLEINGRAGKERIEIAVRDSVTSVQYTDKEPFATFEHLEAMNVLFADICPRRSNLPLFAQCWLPLPIFLYTSDAV